METFVCDIEEQTRQWCTNVNQSTGVIVNLKEPDPELTGATCPHCGSPLRFTTVGIGCAAYPFTKCLYTIWGNVAQKQLSKNQLGLLATKGKTPPFKGFTSKKGEKFDAALVLDKKPGASHAAFHRANNNDEANLRPSTACGNQEKSHERPPQASPPASPIPSTYRYRYNTRA